MKRGSTCSSGHGQAWWRSLVGEFCLRYCFERGNLYLFQYSSLKYIMNLDGLNRLISFHAGFHRRVVNWCDVMVPGEQAFIIIKPACQTMCGCDVSHHFAAFYANCLPRYLKHLCLFYIILYTGRLMCVLGRGSVVPSSFSDLPLRPGLVRV